MQRASWLAIWKVWLIGLFLAVAGIVVVIGFPFYRRMQALKYLDDHGAEYQLTGDSEWMTESFGEWTKPFRGVASIRFDREVTDESLIQASVFSEAISINTENDVIQPISLRAMHALSNMTRLERVRLKGPGFSDEGLAAFFAADPPLTHVTIHSTRASHGTLQELSRISTIVELRVHGDEHSDEDFQGLQALPRLRKFSSRNSGDICAEWLSHSPEIELLALTNPVLTNAGFSALAKLPNLKDLRLFTSSISDDDLRLIGGVTSLESLRLWKCERLTEAGISHLSGLSNLRYLGAPDQCVTLESVGVLLALPNLDEFEFFGSDVSIVSRAVIDLRWGSGP